MLFQNQLHYGAYVPGEYGPTPLGSNDDGPAIQAAHDAMPAEGGTLLLPAGTFNVNTPVVLSRPNVKLVGGGQQGVYDLGGTVLTTSLPNLAGNNALLTVTNHGFVCEDIGLRNTNNNVQAMRGMVIDIAVRKGVLNNEPFGDTFHLSRTSFNGFDVNLDVINGFCWTITNCQSRRSQTVGFRLASEKIPDAGDGSIMGCLFAPGSRGGRGILHKSSGGLRLVNNKFNGDYGQGYFSHSYEFVADYSKALPGALAATSILLIEGNSFENMTTGIKISSVFTLVNISGNEFACYVNPGGEGIWLNNVECATVYGNVFQNLGFGGGEGFARSLRLTNCLNTKRGLNVKMGPGLEELIEGGSGNIGSF